MEGEDGGHPRRDTERDLPRSGSEAEAGDPRGRMSLCEGEAEGEDGEGRWRVEGPVGRRDEERLQENGLWGTVDFDCTV